MEILGEFSNGVLGISKLNFWGWNFWDPGMEFWGNNWEFGDFRVFGIWEWNFGVFWDWNFWEFWGIFGIWEWNFWEFREQNFRIWNWNFGNRILENLGNSWEFGEWNFLRIVEKFLKKFGKKKSWNFFSPFPQSVTPFYNLSSLLALLAPRCSDGIPKIRWNSVDCVQSLLRIQLCYEGGKNSPTFQQEKFPIFQLFPEVFSALGFLGEIF